MFGGFGCIVGCVGFSYFGFAMFWEIGGFLVFLGTFRRFGFNLLLDFGWISGFALVLNMGLVCLVCLGCFLGILLVF